MLRNPDFLGSRSGSLRPRGYRKLGSAFTQFTCEAHDESDTTFHKAPSAASNGKHSAPKRSTMRQRRPAATRRWHAGSPFVTPTTRDHAEMPDYNQNRAPLGTKAAASGTRRLGSAHGASLTRPAFVTLSKIHSKARFGRIAKLTRMLVSITTRISGQSSMTSPGRRELSWSFRSPRPSLAGGVRSR